MKLVAIAVLLLVTFASAKSQQKIRHTQKETSCTLDNGTSGVCMHTEQCESLHGEHFKGLCPGHKWIRCCVIPQEEEEDEPSLIDPVPEVVQGDDDNRDEEIEEEIQENNDNPVSLPDGPDCTIDDGTQGACTDVDICAAAPYHGTSHGGFCSGPNRIKCCTVPGYVPPPPPPPPTLLISDTFTPPSNANLANRASSTVTLTPAIKFDDERGNPYRVRVSSFNPLPSNSSLRVAVGGNHLHKLCADRFNAMNDDAPYNFRIASGWRNHRFRNDYNYYCQQMKARYPTLSCAQARAKIAFKSPHETGLAFDLGSPHPFAPSFSRKSAQLRSPAYRWLKNNAHKYGITPYKHEPWHWECVIPRESFVTGEEFTDNYACRVQEASANNPSSYTFHSSFPN